MAWWEMMNSKLVYHSAPNEPITVQAFAFHEFPYRSVDEAMRDDFGKCGLIPSASRTFTGEEFRVLLEYYPWDCEHWYDLDGELESVEVTITFPRYEWEDITRLP